MSEIRRRKGNHHRRDKGGRSGEAGKLGDASKESPKANQNYTDYVLKDASSWSIWDIINAVIGLSIAAAVSVRYALYAKELHENEMWFSNIGQVEREISFRTESGLYFSYYKQMVLAPSISEGFYQLTHDNKTENLLTINILHRFNVYQEVILGVLYRILPIKDSMEYVYFYIDSVFGLHGMFVFSIYVGSWMMSGSWCSGLLGACLFIFNRSDSTRVSFTIPLRESFSLPFIFAQLAAITVYFKEPISNRVKNISLVLIYVTTFFLVLTWQFAQFVLLLEGFALFGTWSLELISGKKVRHVLFAIAGSLLAVSVLQFLNDMLLASLALSFSLSAITVMLIQDDFEVAPGFFRKLLRVFTLVTGVLTMCIAMNLLIKWGLKVDSDEHVFKFLLSKFGFAQNMKKDFDALLYLCEGAFQTMPFDTFSRLTEGVVFPIYVVAAVVVGLLLLVHIYQRSSSETGDSSIWLLQQHPEIGFHLVLTLLFGAMGMTTLRMKFLWVPHMCLFASGAFCQSKVWRWLLWKIEVKELLGKIISHLVPLCLLAALLWSRLQPTLEELKDLREFYDPDTVDLMNWIKSSTPPDAGFSGSMQLMAGVKLCTDRPITNHPHYENKFLRQRTKEVYQMYARRRPQDVAQILKKHGANYIILENSICYSRQDRGCRLIDLLDLDNGDQLEKDIGTSGAKQIPRFCHAIKSNSKAFQRYFQKVFENRTFYVYKVKS